MTIPYGLDYKTYRRLRAYCWQDLAAYLESPEQDAARRMFVKLANGQIGEIEFEQQQATSLFHRRDLTPRELAAAHLLATISNHRAITWQRELTPPAGREPSPALDGSDGESLTRQTHESVTEYVTFLSECEAKALMVSVKHDGLPGHTVDDPGHSPMASIEEISHGGERAAVAKLVGALVLIAYKPVGGLAKHGLIAEILKDIESLSGVSVSRETIDKWLKLASEKIK